VSKAVLGCHEVLNTLGRSNSVTLMWIPGHSDFTGNAKADELAKLGSEAAYIGPEPALGMAHGEAKKSITEWCYQEHSDLWLRTTRLAHSKEFIRGPSKNRTNNLLPLSRLHLSAVTALYTGHYHLRTHMHRIGLAEDAECRWCMEEEEPLANSTPGLPYLNGRMYAQETWTASHPEQLFGSSGSRVFWMSFNLCVSHNRLAVAVEGRICPLTLHNYQLTIFSTFVSRKSASLFSVLF